jgi:hypothetical protein
MGLRAVRLGAGRAAPGACGVGGASTARTTYCLREVLRGAGEQVGEGAAEGELNRKAGGAKLGQLALV